MDDHLDSDFVEQDEADNQEEARTLEDWVVHAFELGYSLGRNFSEYSGRAKIEPLALIGMDAEATKKKRERAAGDTSKKLRVERRQALFDKNAELAGRNPDILGTGPIKSLALGAIH